uniref:Putative Sigma-24 (FecI-like) n=1 Tax=Magnetococcus massalia (strain MO-1) TaxID=451514 RepID=A0A1S7LGT0_MAGMO|nr:putative Sigma-24 (FecI-like) [Candidatus Magnetococcus massalia]
MKTRNRYEGIHSTAITLIRREATKLSRHPAFNWADQEDFEQELALHVLDRIRYYDGARAGLISFLSQVIRNHAIRMFEHETTVMRGGRFSHVSLNAPLINDEGCEVERIETISESQKLWRSGPDSAQSLENQIEAQAILSFLPPELQSLVCDVAHTPITDISRSRSIPRSTIYEALSRARRLVQKKMLPEADVFTAVPVCNG